MIIDIIHKVLAEKSPDTAIKIGYIKEVLQSEVLDFLYRSEYKDLLFYGGTAMRFLLGLDRLSEDLDFVGRGFDRFEELGKDLQIHFRAKNIEIDYKIQKFRIILKFKNFLQIFRIKFENSDDLHLKVEISDHFAFCSSYQVKRYPILYQGKSMLIQSLDESTLFATKLNAVLYRQRSKANTTGVMAVKGRDFYDLFRYLQKNIQPNINCIQDIKDKNDLIQKLTKIIENTNFDDIVKDILSFVEDKQMIDFLKTNGKVYLLEKISNM